MNGLKSGKSAPAARTAAAGSDGTYLREIVEWGKQNFPDLVDENGDLHMAVFGAIWRLHARHGKGSVTKREHGRWIREHVAAFEMRYGVSAKDAAKIAGLETPLKDQNLHKRGVDA